MSENDPDRSRRTMLIAGAVLAVILAVGLVVSLIGVLDDDAPEAGPTDPSSSTTPDSGDGVCELSETTSEATSLSAPPAGTTWDLINGVAVPTVPTAGPGVVEDSGVRYCYAHTPEGALLAAANLFGWAAAAQTDPEALVDRNIAAGPGAEAFRESAAAGFEGGGESPGVQIQGFKINSYTDESALIDVALGSAGETGFARIQLELVWEGSDWRVRLLPDGGIPPFESIPDLTGYVPWNGA